MAAHGLFIRLREQRPYASPSERNIIDYIQAHPREAVSQSSRALAAATFTSASTVMRFCRRLGYDGYRAFIRELMFELAALDEQSDATLEDVDPADDPSVTATKVVRADIQSLEATRRLIDLDALDRCADLIIEAASVAIFGIGASLLVAHDLELKLLRADKPVSVYDDLHSQLLCAKNLHPEDLAIVVSYSGFTDEMIQCASYAQMHGTPVIAITRVGNNAGLARHADELLCVASSEPLMRSGAMGSRMSQLLVVDALFATYVTKDFERCSPLMRRNYTAKVDSERHQRTQTKKGSDADA